MRTTSDIIAEIAYDAFWDNLIDADETSRRSYGGIQMKNYTRAQCIFDGQMFLEESLMVASDGTGIYECRERPDVCNNYGGFMEVNHEPEVLTAEQVSSYLTDGDWVICRN